MNWPQENTKIARKKRHKFFSLSSLCAFAAKSSWNWVIPHCGAAEGLVVRPHEGDFEQEGTEGTEKRERKSLCPLHPPVQISLGGLASGGGAVCSYAHEIKYSL
jgi:hypothetical protein